MSWINNFFGMVAKGLKATWIDVSIALLLYFLVPIIITAIGYQGFKFLSFDTIPNLAINVVLITLYLAFIGLINEKLVK